MPWTAFSCTRLILEEEPHYPGIGSDNIDIGADDGKKFARTVCKRGDDVDASTRGDLHMLLLLSSLFSSNTA